MPRWLVAVGMGVVGLSLGLVYGWIINPVKFLDTTPASLRVDYRADYVLMVAEAYHAQKNPDVAQRQLAVFGGETPAIVCAHALQAAQQAGYSPQDVSLIQELMLAMQAAAPAPTSVGNATGGAP